jgi:hypothetical protein
MALRLPALAVLGVIVWLLIRSGGLKAPPAAAAVLLGFFLKDSSLAPAVTTFVQSLASLLSRLHL